MQWQPVAERTRLVSQKIKSGDRPPLQKRNSLSFGLRSSHAMPAEVRERPPILPVRSGCIACLSVYVPPMPYEHNQISNGEKIIIISSHPEVRSST
jgi:hypothetical protein